MPFGNSVAVDRKRFTDLINELRLAIPANVRQARGILERGEQAIEEAQQEAARIVANADREAAARVAQSEILRRAQEEAQRVEAATREGADRITRAAEQRAHQLVAEAEQIAQQQKDDADAYAVALMRQLQQMLGMFLGNVRKSLESFPEHDQ